MQQKQNQIIKKITKIFENDGRKFIILKKKDGNDILYIKDINGNILRTIKAKYNGGNNDDNLISQGFNDYSNSLIQKYFYNKINNSNQAILENEKIKKFFGDTEGSSSKKNFVLKLKLQMRLILVIFLMNN